MISVSYRAGSSRSSRWSIWAEGCPVLPDQWTQSTADGKPSAHFEHTVALTEAGPMVLDRRAQWRELVRSIQVLGLSSKT